MLLMNVSINEWSEVCSLLHAKKPPICPSIRRLENIMDLDELYALLTIGALTPYVVGATIDWMEKSGCSKSIGKFLRSQFSQLQN